MYEQLFSIYLKTFGGIDPFPPESLDDLESFVRKKLVRTKMCNKDRAFDHGAKTCKVELAWITGSGKQQMLAEMENTIDTRLEKLDVKFNSMNPHIAILVKHLLLKWAISTINHVNQIPHANTHSYSTHAYANSWSIPVPHFRSSDTEILPKIVKCGIDDVKATLKEIGLAAEHSTHNTSGWKSGDSLVTTLEIAKKIADKYWASEIPWPIDMLIHSVFKTFAEKRIAFSLDYGKIGERELLEYLEVASYQELSEFLFLLHTSNKNYDRHFEHDPINWKGIRKLLWSHYLKDKDDPDFHDYLVRRIIHGQHLERIFEWRYLAVLAKTRKCILDWVETGTITIAADISSWHDSWESTELFLGATAEKTLVEYYVQQIKPNLYHYKDGY